MTKLTERESEVLAKLRAEIESDVGDGFGTVYLDNAVNTNDPVVRGVLGSLEQKGMYRPLDGYAFADVKKAD